MLSSAIFLHNNCRLSNVMENIHEVAKTLEPWIFPITLDGLQIALKIAARRM